MTEMLVAGSHLTEAHVELLNHYLPGEEMTAGVRILGDILEHVPIDGSAALGPCIAGEVRRIYVMLRYGMRDKPLLSSETISGFEQEAAGVECIYLADALVLLALENRRLLPERHPQSVQ